MWQTDWAERPRQTADSEGPQSSSLAPATVVPPIFSPGRSTASSVRFLIVIRCVPCMCAGATENVRDSRTASHRIRNIPGLFSFGAEIEFRRWGKLESAFGFGPVRPWQSRWLDVIDRVLLRCIYPLSSLLR